MHLGTDSGQDLHLFRLMELTGQLRDAVDFSGRGVCRDGVWQFPSEGMAKRPWPRRRRR